LVGVVSLEMILFGNALNAGLKYIEKGNDFLFYDFRELLLKERIRKIPSNVVISIGQGGNNVLSFFIESLYEA